MCYGQLTDSFPQKKWVVDNFQKWSMTGIPLNKLNEELEFIRPRSSANVNINYDCILDSLTCKDDIIEVYLRVNPQANIACFDYSLRVASNCRRKEFLLSHITKSEEVAPVSFEYNRLYNIYNLKDEYLSKNNNPKKSSFEGFILKIEVENGYIHLIEGIVFY